MTSLRTSLFIITMMVAVSTVTMSSAFAASPYIGAYIQHMRFPHIVNTQ